MTTCLAGYGCEQNVQGTITHEGMDIYFSGDSRVPPVEETIVITKTSTPLRLFVKAFGTGSGSVTWTYDAVDPCPQTLAGCQPCETYGKKSLVLYFPREWKC